MSKGVSFDELLHIAQCFSNLQHLALRHYRLQQPRNQWKERLQRAAAPAATKRLQQQLEIDAGGDARGAYEGTSLTLPKYDARSLVGQSAWGLGHLYARGRGLWLTDRHLENPAVAAVVG